MAMRNVGANLVNEQLMLKNAATAGRGAAAANSGAVADKAKSEKAPTSNDGIDQATLARIQHDAAVKADVETVSQDEARAVQDDAAQNSKTKKKGETHDDSDIAQTRAGDAELVGTRKVEEAEEIVVKLDAAQEDDLKAADEFALRGLNEDYKAKNPAALEMAKGVVNNELEKADKAGQDGLDLKDPPREIDEAVTQMMVREIPESSMEAATRFAADGIHDEGAKPVPITFDEADEKHLMEMARPHMEKSENADIGAQFSAQAS